MKLEGFFDETLSPRVTIAVSGKPITLVVDTGFNGELMLPRRLLKELGFKYTMKSEADLVDGSLC